MNMLANSNEQNLRNLLMLLHNQDYRQPEINIFFHTIVLGTTIGCISEQQQKTTMAFKLGSFVKLHGLVKAAQFNGMVAVIVAPKTSEERWGVQLLDHALRWEDDPTNKKKCGGKQMAVKESNLTLSRDSNVWRESHIGNGLSILELVLGSPELAQETICDQFCEKVWNCCFETIPGQSLTVDHDLKWREALLNATGHKMFWLSLHGLHTL
jgi:hypothetical protein